MSTSAAAPPDRRVLLVAAALVLVSFVIYVPTTIFHPSGVDPNNHLAVFLQYANSSGWTADHLGWFVQTAVLIVGLLVLLHVVDPGAGMASMLARITIVTACAALALTALRDLVDGVVLKRAVDAWAIAPDAEKAARFASAETVRWLEEASASYQGFVLGLTLVLLAVLILWTARAPRGVALFLVLGGVGYIVQGWIVSVYVWLPGWNRLV